ncbi:MAG: hypothetical protein K6F23_05175 [Solobacterium sp.]|nr:hypothetical protein [Solobacterium sp.]
MEYQPHTVVRKGKSFYYVWHVQGTGMTLLRLNSTGNIPVNYKGKLYYVSPKTAVPAGTGEGYLPAGSLTGSIRKERTMTLRQHMNSNILPEHCFSTVNGTISTFFPVTEEDTAWT